MKTYMIETILWIPQKMEYVIKATNQLEARQKALRRTRRDDWTDGVAVGHKIKPRTTLLSYKRLK